MSVSGCCNENNNNTWHLSDGRLSAVYDCGLNTFLRFVFPVFNSSWKGPQMAAVTAERSSSSSRQHPLQCLHSSGNELFSESAHLERNTTLLKIYCCKSANTASWTAADSFFMERRRGSLVYVWAPSGRLLELISRVGQSWHSLSPAKQDPLGALGISKSCDVM